MNRVFNTQLWDAFYFDMLLDALQKENVQKYNVSQGVMTLQVLVSLKAEAPELFARIPRHVLAHLYDDF